MLVGGVFMRSCLRWHDVVIRNVYFELVLCSCGLWLYVTCLGRSGHSSGQWLLKGGF